MPVLEGLEVARRVLADHPDQVVILCTAFVTTRSSSKAAEVGVRSVLGKQQIHRLADEILRLVD